MAGLDEDELAAQHAAVLPAREQMSLLTSGGVGAGLASAGVPTTDPAAGGTTPDAGAAEPYVEGAARTQGELTQQPQANTGVYDPDQTASARSG